MSLSPKASGIIYEYEDGGRYCGEWDNDQAHGYGVCTGPEGKGLFEGVWVKGDQASGVFVWPTGQRYTGTWEQGVREGMGLETKPGGTEYCGEFTRDARGPHGVLRLPNGAVYSGTWNDGVQDGEGVETYADRGIYRGQYKNGVRHGYGTRSSAAYEHGQGKHRASDPATGATGIGRLKKVSQASVLSGSFRVAPESSTTEGLSDENSQVYEGEWKDDRRHGYGVLKVSGHYTYYGEWESNARTGYGVLVRKNGRKEEGQWQRGRLVHVLRRKKLTVAYLKGQSMEGKVKQAHTLALQAASTARNDKAMLAESRAQLSQAKDLAAQKTAQQAMKDAQMAREKAELYKSAPRVAEGLKSQVSLDFPAIDTEGPVLHSKSEASSTDSSGFLTIGKTIAPTPSYEDILNLHKQEEIQSWNGDSDSETSGSTDPLLRADSDPTQSQHWEDFDPAKPIPHHRKAWYQHQHRPHSAAAGSKNSLDHCSERDSFESIYSTPDRLKEEAEKLLEKRRKLLQMKPTASDQTFENVTEYGEKRSRIYHERLQRRASDNIPEMHHASIFRMRSKSLSDPDEEVLKETERCEEACPREGVASGSRKARRRKTSATRDKTTGEIGHGDATDDESLNEDHRTVNPESVGQRSKSTLPLPPRPLVKKPSVTMDMLTQMADWNKMVAYINFGLLIFLLLLIIIVVIGMNYYYLSHNMNMPQHGPGFTPMA